MSTYLLTVHNGYSLQVEQWWLRHGTSDDTREISSGSLLVLGQPMPAGTIEVIRGTRDYWSACFIDSESSLWAVFDARHDIGADAPPYTRVKASFDWGGERVGLRLECKELDLDHFIPLQVMWAGSITR